MMRSTRFSSSSARGCFQTELSARSEATEGCFAAGEDRIDALGEMERVAHPLRHALRIGWVDTDLGLMAFERGEAIAGQHCRRVSMLGRPGR